MAESIVLRGVGRRFVSGGKSLDALSDVNLEITRGHRVAVVGPSGSGKSTLLNLIGALDRPDTGIIECFGYDISHNSEKQSAEFRRQHVGFVFQDDALMPELTVRENVEMPLVLLRQAARWRRQRVEDLLARLGILAKADSFPATLSGGEKQRVAVARAVIHHPQIVLADEPTSNLDAESAMRVLSLLGELAQSDNLTLLLATHDTRVVEHFSEVVRLQDGRVVN